MKLVSRLQRAARIAAASFLVSGWLYSGACSGSSSPGSGMTGAPDIADVIYVGSATDEGLALLLGSKVVEMPSSTPVITSPAEGATLSGPSEFSYRIGAMALRTPRGEAAGARSFAWNELFGPERVASAHGSPMNGPAFLLTFSTPSNSKILRVFTQETSYSPADAEWQRLLATGSEIKLTVTLAIFDEGLIVPQGGPFVSAPVRFSPQP